MPSRCAIWARVSTDDQNTGNQLAELLAAIYAWMARAESARRSERVRAGLERRRREGKPVGRQRCAADKRPRSAAAMWPGGNANMTRRWVR